MKNNRQRLQILLQHPELSNREIARQQLCSPTTIGRLRSRITVLGLTLDQLNSIGDTALQQWLYDHQVAPGDRITPNWDMVLANLQAGDNRQEAYDRFLESGGEGTPIAYRTFCKHLEPLLDQKNPTMRLLHKPGDKVMVDYAGFAPKGMIDGKERSLQLFVARLPASTYGFACVSATQTIPDWLAANEAMFRYFGGVTHCLVSDNLRAAVTQHRRGKAPVLNATFARFAEHFDTALTPARPGKPKDKAAVERFVQDIQRKLRRALSDRPLLSISEMNVLLLELVGELNNRAPRRALGETRRELFERIDRPMLRPLPDSPFVFFTEKQVKVQPTYHIDVDGIEYSVPHRLIARNVIVRMSRALIEMFYDGKLVALHQRQWEHGEPVTDTRHMPPHHRAWRAKETADLMLWAEGWNEPVRTIIAAETARGYKGKVKQLQFDLVDKLVRAFGRDAFEQACARACMVGNPTISHVRNLLKLNRQRSPIRPLSRPTPMATADNVRGADYYAGEA